MCFSKPSRWLWGSLKCEKLSNLLSLTSWMSCWVVGPLSTLCHLRALLLTAFPVWLALPCLWCEGSQVDQLMCLSGSKENKFMCREWRNKLWKQAWDSGLSPVAQGVLACPLSKGIYWIEGALWLSQPGHNSWAEAVICFSRREESCAEGLFIWIPHPKLLLSQKEAGEEEMKDTGSRI